MPVIDIHLDTENLTLTLTAEFAAPVERVWQVWEDPRQLERWWGPPGYAATVELHEFRPGGRVAYYMTGPDGTKYPGWWRITEIAPPSTLVFEDGFADENGNEVDTMPTTSTRVTLNPNDDGRTRMHLVSTFPSLEAMQQLAEMGMEEGLRLSVGQIDGLVVVP